MAETTPAENKEIVQRFYEGINQRNVDSLPEFFAADGGTCGGRSLEDMVSNPLLPGARLVPATTARRREREGASALPREMDALLDFTMHMFSAFPDIQVSIDSMVAEGDTVVVRWSARGTQSGEFLGMPPTGRTVPFSSIDFFTMRDGKIASHSGYPDTARVLAALGQLPLTPMATLLSGPDSD